MPRFDRALVDRKLRQAIEVLHHARHAALERAAINLLDRVLAHAKPRRDVLDRQHLLGISLDRLSNIAAAEGSLLLLERSHGDSFPKVGGAYSADRLLLANWLLRGGRFAPTDSMRLTEGRIISAMAEAAGSVFGGALLQCSRVAEGLGKKAGCEPAAKSQVDDAHERFTRLRGTDAAKRKRGPLS